ncbi:MAG: translation initiation factor IF-2 [Candidatus Aenigmarchaeota archaeon]|nr:translation initiation factor IF-2 [Candidatus Aenigmarchaeota archaeon]
MKNIRSPIISVLGHVDHGKTSLLDSVRGTAIAKSEPGAITQHISASYVPSDVIGKISKKLLEKFNIEMIVPGLLFIDSPGHEAFTTLRKRGGSIADLAILVIDIFEGFMPQTDESLNILKQFKTPFVVAATKIDKIAGWTANYDASFLESFELQSPKAQERLEGMLYTLVGQLSERGFEGDRYDRISDFTKRVAFIPVSSHTREGISDLLMMLAGISQRYLQGRLEAKGGGGKGTILEVKEYKGLGITLDVIIYEGTVKRGDYLAMGGKTPIVSKIKALLEPKALNDMRAEKEFEQIESATAAAGVKIAGPGLGGAVAGMPVRIVSSKKEVEQAVRDVKAEVEEVEIATSKDGVILKADTLGSLEALIKSLRPLVPIRKAEVGRINKYDVLESSKLSRPVIFSFCVRCDDEIQKIAADNKVKIFGSDVIYKLIEEYKEWEIRQKALKEAEWLKNIVRPAKLKVLRGYVFRQSKPAIFGVEIIAGSLRSGCTLSKKGVIVGKVKEMQQAGENIQEAKTGMKIAISVSDAVFGRDVHENDVLHVYLSPEDIIRLGKIEGLLTDEEKLLVAEIKAGKQD